MTITRKSSLFTLIRITTLDLDARQLNTKRLKTVEFLFLWICGMLFSTNVIGQDFKKILLKSELDSLENGFSIYKKIDKTNCKDFDNFQGNMTIQKNKKTYEWHFVGLASQYDNSGVLKSQFNFDDEGQMKTYQEFFGTGELSYNCIYEYKTINDSYYRLEHQRLYISPNKLREDGWRYLKLRNNKGQKCDSSQRNFGIRIYYYEDGTIESSTDYGQIK